MHDFIFSLVNWYLGTLDQFGLMGLVVLMAMESSIFPVPSELVLPPAAYLEVYCKSDGGMHAVLLSALVIITGTLGSYLGSAVTYALARLAGRPLILKYGKYFFIPRKKLELAEQWVAHYGAGGIFFARLLPVVRHLISIPAGLIGMRFSTFSLMTLIGSFVWCTVLTVFGLFMAEDLRAMVEFGTNVESAGYKHAFANLTWATISLVVAVGVMYAFVIRSHGKHPRDTTKDSMLT